MLKTGLVENRFGQKPVSSKTGFSQNRFQPKPVFAIGANRFQFIFDENLKMAIARATGRDFVFVCFLCFFFLSDTNNGARRRS